MNGAGHRAALAAHNNAAWCSALCAAHGDGGEWTAAAWLRRTPAPPYYPNLVTLEPSADAAVLAPLLNALPAGVVCGVKDSFAQLDLHGHGFRVLFESQWLWREPGAPLPADDSALVWRVVDRPANLAAWEAGWWADVEPGTQRPRLFPDSLLQHPDLRFVAGHHGDRLVAGGVWSRTQAPGAPRRCWAWPAASALKAKTPRCAPRWSAPPGAGAPACRRWATNPAPPPRRPAPVASNPWVRCGCG